MEDRNIGMMGKNEVPMIPLFQYSSGFDIPTSQHYNFFA
jgi:hypothetical protein